MTVLVEATPEPAAAFDFADETEGSESVVQLAGLAAVYDNRLEVYDHELSAELAIAAGDQPTGVSAYPVLAVTLPDEEPEELVIDGDLHEQLFDIYAVHGWEGVAVVERELVARARPEQGAAAGGTTADVWGSAHRFFLFTRNLVAVLVRDALVTLEQCSTDRLLAQLERAEQAVDAAFVEFGIERTDPDDDTDPNISRPPTFEFRAREHTAAVFAATHEIVEQRAEVDAAVRMLADVEYLAWRYRRFGVGRPPSEEHERVTGNLEQQRAALQSFERQAQALLDGLLRVAGASSPFALLVIEGLRRDDGQSAFEAKLGAALSALRSAIRDTRRELDRRVAHAAALDGPALEEVTVPSVQAMRVPPNGIDRALAEGAVEGMVNDAGWFPLVHESTLQEVVKEGDVARDSFAYVVHFHYTEALAEAVERRRQSEAAQQRFWRSFSRGAAAASLALLVTPAGKVGVVLRGVSAAADLVLLAHSLHSVIDRLARLDAALAEQLLDPDAFTMAHLGRLGELVDTRADLLDDLALEAVLSLAAQAASSWLPIRHVIAARGYLDDLETLLPDEDETQEEDG